jgi:hypothetical protein
MLQKRRNTGNSLRWLSLLLCFAGCSHAPLTSDGSTTSPPLLSHDGHLRYEVPAGWFDATGKPGALQAVIWIVRQDYGASISVNRVEVMPDFRQEVSEGRLLRLGELTMRLLLSSRPGTVERPPALVRMEGKEYCLYEVEESSTHDLMRSVIFDTGTRVYAVTALVPGGEPASTREEILAVHQNFVRRLRW